jgi:hypothetical protein
MSGKAQGRVYEMDVSGNEQAVLLAMADSAEHDGSGMHVVIDVIAYKTGLNWRTCTRIIGRFTKSGWLASDGVFRLDSGQKIPVYRFNYERVEWKPTYKEWVKGNGRRLKRDVSVTPLSDDKTSESAEERDVSLTPLSNVEEPKRGVKSNTKGVSKGAKKGCHSCDTLYSQSSVRDTAKLSASGSESESESTNAREKFANWLSCKTGKSIADEFKREGMAEDGVERRVLWRCFERDLDFDAVQTRMVIMRSMFDEDPGLTYWPGWWIKQMLRDGGDECLAQYRHRNGISDKAVTMSP